jgi:hypothetical protein
MENSRVKALMAELRAAFAEAGLIGLEVDLIGADAKVAMNKSTFAQNIGHINAVRGDLRKAQKRGDKLLRRIERIRGELQKIAIEEAQKKQEGTNELA